MSSIGERIKSNRIRAGLSLRDLAVEAGVSAQAISKYERGLDVPGSAVLIRLAQVLKVRVEHLLRQMNVTLSQPTYRSHASRLRDRDEGIVQAQVQDWLERYLGVEGIVGGQVEFHLPDINRHIEKFDDIEQVAVDLRSAWQLGLDPIDNLVEILEGHGIKAGMVEGTDHFDALTLMANETIPVIVVKQNVPGDRQRLSMAHELGHLILDIPEEMDVEKAAFRFAGAFLAPASAVKAELGNDRQRLDLYELHLLKHKYGMSMQAWIHRAQDLGVISGATAATMYRWFRSKGWHRDEPGDAYPSPKMDRLERLVVRALAEDMVSETRAAELLGMSLSEFWKQASKLHDGFPLPVYC